MFGSWTDICDRSLSSWGYDRWVSQESLLAAVAFAAMNSVVTGGHPLYVAFVWGNAPVPSDA